MMATIILNLKLVHISNAAGAIFNYSAATIVKIHEREKESLLVTRGMNFLVITIAENIKYFCAMGLHVLA
ncbi:hypothetical protein OROMI_000875 [Orobanche minor]